MPPRPLPFAFSPRRFFRFSFLSVGKGFAKSPRIVKFLEGTASGQWDKIFTGIFWSKLHGFLRFSLACLTESRSFGYGLKDLVFLQTFLVKVV